MQAVVLDQFGEPAEVLGVREIPRPEPGRGEVRVRMLVSPVNPSDLMMIRGQYGLKPSLPAVPGFEGVGVVEDSGGGLLGRLLRGKRVAALNSSTGNWCQETVIPAKQAVPIPNGISIEDAAMFFVNPVTAYLMTRQVLQVPAGAWLLQSAAGSALGRMVIRLGRRYGFRTISLVRREVQAEALRKDPERRTPDELIFSTEKEDWPDEIRRQTGGDGVEFAIDAVGGATGTGIMRCLGRRGRLLVYGTLSGEPISFSPRDLLTTGGSVSGFWLTNYMQGLGLLAKLRLINAVGKLVRSGTLKAGVAASFPLAEIKEAVTLAETTARDGKVLLRIGD